MGVVLLTAGLFYLCLTFLIVWGFKVWEKRWHAHLRPRDVRQTAPRVQPGAQAAP